MTAMAMAVMMAAAGFGTGRIDGIAYAAEADSEKITFPDVYTEDLVQPIEDDEIVNEKVEALIKTMTTEEKYTFLGGNGTGDKEVNKISDETGVAKITPVFPLSFVIFQNGYLIITGALCLFLQ